jgi:hypothetical protein
MLVLAEISGSVTWPKLTHVEGSNELWAGILFGILLAVFITLIKPLTPKSTNWRVVMAIVVMLAVIVLVVHYQDYVRSVLPII